MAHRLFKLLFALMLLNVVGALFGLSLLLSPFFVTVFLPGITIWRIVVLIGVYGGPSFRHLLPKSPESVDPSTVFEKLCVKYRCEDVPESLVTNPPLAIKAAQEMHRLLLGVFEKEIGAVDKEHRQDLLIVAHDAIALVPFAALVGVLHVTV